MLAVTELFNIAANDMDAKKYAGYSQVFVVSALIVNGTQCIHLETSTYCVQQSMPIHQSSPLHLPTNP